jgi:UDP-glucose 4-epimerase
MPESRTLVIGGAGFIGSHLVERLVAEGPVTVLDDFSVGRREFLEGASATGQLDIVAADARDLDVVCRAAIGHSCVIHLAANPEARWGLENTRLDLELGTITTYNALEAARRAGARRFLFASSGTVYGDVAKRCREEDLGLPISLYGASKLAAEAMISAFSECFGLVASTMRFGNVVGPRGTHGAALDFLRKLQKTPHELEVLGDGTQSKPYLHVDDCVSGMLFTLARQTSRFDVWNLAPPDTTAVSEIAALCVRCSPYPTAAIRYTGGDRGWPGDVPKSRMSPEKLAGLGFRVGHTSYQAVERAVVALAREVFPA